MHQPSVAYFKRHFASLDPERPHRFRLAASDVTVDIPTLAQRAPRLSGAPLRVTGRLEQLQQVTVYDRAQSWAFFLQDRAQPDTIAICRVPLAHGDESAYAVGDRIHARGTLLADGAAPRLDEPGAFRVVYLICSSVGRTQARITLTPRGIDIREYPNRRGG